MHKRIFMLGDSNIWGTEHIAPDGKICESPYLSMVEIDPKYSKLPSETTYPYFLDDWKETVNLAWPGFGIDYVVDRFIHKILDPLEPDDVVSVFLPMNARKMYARPRLSSFFNEKDFEGVLKDKTIDEVVFTPSVLGKVNNRWTEIIENEVLEHKDVVKGFDRHGLTNNDKEAYERFLSFDSTRKKQFFIDSDLFMRLTFYNSATQIYNLINAIVTIERLARAKKCPNIFYVIASDSIDQNTNNNATIKNIKTVLGKDICERILCWDWHNKMKGYYFHKSKIKDKKQWQHEGLHHTAFAHQYFADQIKAQFLKRLKR